MFTGVAILMLLLLIAIIILIINVIYFICYKNIINRRIRQGVTNGRKMIAPGYLVIISLVAALGLFSAGVSMMRINAGNSETIPDAYMEASYDFDAFTPEEMEESYLSMYSMEENPGYERKEEIIGDVKFIYFVSKETFNWYHPSFIIFAEYIGSDSGIVAQGFEGEFLTEQGKVICGKGAAGSDKTEYLCVVGSVSVDCTFSLSYYLYDETELTEGQEAQGEETEEPGGVKDNAAVYSTLEIELEGMQE